MRFSALHPSQFAGEFYPPVFYLAVFCEKFEAELTDFNGEADHVHLLVETTPNTPSIAKLINSLKAVSSRRLRQEFCGISGSYGKPVLWSRSYFAGTCGGAPLEVIKQYIENQDQP